MDFNILNFMNINQVGATLKHGDGQTNMMKVTGTFHDYLNKEYTRAVFKYLKITHCWDFFPPHGQKLKVSYNLNKCRWHFRIVQKDLYCYMFSKQMFYALQDEWKYAQY